MKTMTGAQFKAWRAATGRTQLQASFDLGFTPRQIAGWERKPDSPIYHGQSLALSCSALTMGLVPADHLMPKTQESNAMPIPEVAMPDAVEAQPVQEIAKQPEIIPTEPIISDPKEAAIMRLAERAYLANAREDPDSPPWDTLTEEDHSYFRRIVVTVLADRDSVAAAMHTGVSS